MLSYHETLDIILNAATPRAPQKMALDHLTGLVAGETLTGDALVPPFDNSAMDGFAVHSDQIAGATRTHPVVLTVDGSTMAGDRPATGQRGAWEIMTGAPVPKAYDAVIRIEDSVILEQNDAGRPTRIAITVSGFPGKNIRKAGTDFAPGDRLLDKGMRIGPPQIMALAALGQDQVSVIPAPRAAVISTGKELVDDMDQPLKPGQIRNSNAPYLLAGLRALDCPAVNAGTIFDDPEKFDQKINALRQQDFDLILSSGAVSMGRHDFIPDGLRRQGAEILCHKAAIRPGKPILFARLPDGAFYFGLPGNPIAAAVGLRFFAYPLIRKLRGQRPETPVVARLKNAFTKESPFRFFQKARCHHDSEGQLHVEVLPGQESYKISPLLQQNCWAVIPETGLNLRAGHLVDVYPLFPESEGGFL